MISLVDIVNMNNMVYSDNIKKKHLDVINNPAKPFDTFDTSQWMAMPPPKNSSQATFREILQIDAIPLDNKFIHEGDKTIEYFEKWFIENSCGCDHVFPKAFITEVTKAVRSIVLKLKYHYNRPRPKQIAESYRLRFHEEPLESAQTPAYPSGHATQGTLISLILSEIYPEHSMELMNLGADVANSRMVAKVHYASDTSFGVNLAKSLFEHLKKHVNLNEYRITKRTKITAIIAIAEEKKLSLKNLLPENYDLDNHPKKKWIKQQLSNIDDRIMNDIFKHYKAVYSSEGMQLSAFSPSELKSGYEIVMLIDVDKDPMPDAFIFTRGNRVKLLATDGQGPSKSAVVKKVVNMVKSEGYSLEASKKMNDIMIGKGAPVITDKSKIERMVGPKFIKHLDNGYYERKLKKGGNVVKRMYGK
tara:strand:+ start:1613 stop:2863 length:1251 start_codon:yes stop_codon:yes gene_type:complete